MAAEVWLNESALPALPEWLNDLVDALRHLSPQDLSLFLPPPHGARPGAVLILFGEGQSGPEVLIIQRSATMRSHAGQPAFPGGAVDDEDEDHVAAALREAREETGLDPEGVTVFGTLPDLWVPPSGFVVTPVLGWWARPTPVSAEDPAEVESVHVIPIDDLVDPANRVEVRHPAGYVGPGFEVQGLLVWGFTAGLLSRLFERAGWEQPWTPTRIVDVSELI